VPFNITLEEINADEWNHPTIVAMCRAFTEAGVVLHGIFHGSRAPVASDDVTRCNVSGQAETAAGDELLDHTTVDGLARMLDLTSVRAFDGIRDIALRLAFLAKSH
jgi:hypothetical protein